MNWYHSLFFMITVAILGSCNNNESAGKNDPDPEYVFFDYKIWGEEDYENVTVKVQFLAEDEEGRPLLLKAPGKVELDGEVLNADSAMMTGVFYEVQKPLSSFSGRHTITFTTSNKKKYREEFDFQPLTLANPVPETLPRGDLVFDFNGLSPDDNIRVLMTDTSFLSEEINRVDSARNGRLIITKDELRGLGNGPIFLQISKENARPVKNGTAGGGKISIHYGFRREFILKDEAEPE